MIDHYFLKENIIHFRDTVIVCCADALTGFFGGIVVFSVLGFLAKETGTSLDKLPFSGKNFVNFYCQYLFRFHFQSQ